MNTLDLIIVVAVSTAASIGCICCLLCTCAKYCSTVETVVVETNINISHTNPMHKTSNIVNVEVCNEDPV